MYVFFATGGMFYKVKVIFIGSSAVGKTSIVQRYCDDIFTTQTLTVGVDTRVKRVEIDNNLIEVRRSWYCTVY